LERPEESGAERGRGEGKKVRGFVQWLVLLLGGGRTAATIAARWGGRALCAVWAGWSLDSTRAGAMKVRLKGDGGFRDLLEVGRSVKWTEVALDEVVSDVLLYVVFMVPFGWYEILRRS
jgi:hypothetical protein